MRIGMDLTFRRIADRLQIGLGSAYRLYQRYVRSGKFTACKRSDRPQSRKLDEHHELLILGLLIENPGLYLIEICSRSNWGHSISSNGMQASSESRVH